MRHSHVKQLAVVALVCVLSACQTVPQNAGIGDSGWLRDTAFFERSLQQHAQRPKWQFSGKVGIRSPQVNESANLVWSYADQSNQVRMFGPLGAGAIKLDFDRYGVQLSDRQGLLHRGNSAEQLLTEIVGWPIPIDALNYWLFGLPSPAQAYEYQLNEDGQLSSLRQLGWTIDYTAHQAYPPEQDVFARKLRAQKELSSGQQLTVKIVTKSWVW